MDPYQAFIKPEPVDETEYCPLFVSGDENAQVKKEPKLLAAISKPAGSRLGAQYQQDLQDIKLEFDGKTRIQTPEPASSARIRNVRFVNVFMPQRNQPRRAAKASRRPTSTTNDQSIDLDDPAIRYLIATSSGPGVVKPELPDDEYSHSLSALPPFEPSQPQKSSRLEREQKRLQIDGTHRLRKKLGWSATQKWVYVPSTADQEAEDHETASKDTTGKFADGTFYDEAGSGSCVICKIGPDVDILECIQCDELYHLACVGQSQKAMQYEACEKCDRLLPEEYYQCRVCTGFRYCKVCFVDVKETHDPSHRFRHVDDGFTCPDCLPVTIVAPGPIDKTRALSVLGKIRKEQALERKKSQRLMTELGVDAASIAASARLRKKRTYTDKHGPGANHKYAKEQEPFVVDPETEADSTAEKKANKRRRNGRAGFVADVESVDEYEDLEHDGDIAAQSTAMMDIDRPTKTPRSRRSSNIRPNVAEKPQPSSAKSDPGTSRRQTRRTTRTMSMIMES